LWLYGFSHTIVVNAVATIIN